MRKGIFVVCVAVVILAMVMAAAAKVETPKKVEPLNGGGKDDNKGGGGQYDDKGGGGQYDDKGSNSQGQPFLEIWKAIKDLQDKLNSGVTRAEFDELKERVDALEGQVGVLEVLVDALEGRVGVLEARVAVLEECVPVPEICNGIDDDCDRAVDEGANLCSEGYSCTSGVCVSDQQCYDSDSDGVTTCNGDCNDNNPAIYPGAPEVCDGLDNNCNAMTDEGNDLCGSGFVCSGGQCISSSCSPACAADQVCENGNCKFNCAGYSNCLGGCPELPPWDSQYGVCETNCQAQTSSEELIKYNAFQVCLSGCYNPLPDQSCIDNCNSQYQSCVG